MGLHISLTVKRQDERYMSLGNNPKGTREEIQEQLQEALLKRFPNADNTFCLTVMVTDEHFVFDVRMHGYASDFKEVGYEANDMYHALFDFVLSHFSADYGIDIHVSYSP